MLELVVRPRARRDLKGIRQYTLRHWGSIQADKYLNDIDREIRALREFPDSGARHDEIRAGYRALHVKHHLIFYVRRERSLEIVRVLHESMAVDRNL
jgi:toxin ParE1/3/4